MEFNFSNNISQLETSEPKNLKVFNEFCLAGKGSSLWGMGRRNRWDAKVVHRVYISVFLIICFSVLEEGEDDNSVFVDTTMLGILGLLGLMFIVICVVLQMFAKWVKE